MNSIGFTNFRKFAKFPELQFGDITIMVGGNNAGKSTLVKAMLLMRDFLKSRIEAKSDNSIFKSFIPQFYFDSEHVNVGDFYRSFCRQAPVNEDTITFVMRVDKFDFTVNVQGERKPGIIPQVSFLSIGYDKKSVIFDFDFVKNQMVARFAVGKEKQIKTGEEGKIQDRFTMLNTLNERLSMSNDLAEISDLKLQIENLEKEIEAQKRAVKPIVTPVEDMVTVDMSFFMGDNVGKLILPELVKGFVHYAWVGTLGDKSSQKYKAQEGKKNFLKSKAEIINKISAELETVLSSEVVEYIYSHSVAQTPCYSNATSSNDYATRTIHEFYRSRISSGDEEFSIIEDGLSLFGLGKSLQVESVLGLGDSYRVLVFDDETPEGMDLADKGMGSIQIILLLLRLATLAKKYKGTNHVVLLEEPEQNLHPALQSKLADLLYYVNKDYGIRFVVETHSEYLVRKSQVIVAEENFSDEAAMTANNKFKVFYLPNDGEKPYEMQYARSGRFRNKFGEGFFDEAGKSNLITLKKEKSLQ